MKYSTYLDPVLENILKNLRKFGDNFLHGVHNLYNFTSTVQQLKVWMLTT